MNYKLIAIFTITKIVLLDTFVFRYFQKNQFLQTMQYGDLPLFILLLAAIYLTTIYGILKIAEKLAQEENSFRRSNSNGTETIAAYTITRIVKLLHNWKYNLLKNGNYHPKKLSQSFIDKTLIVQNFLGDQNLVEM